MPRPLSVLAIQVHQTKEGHANAALPAGGALGSISPLLSQKRAESKRLKLNSKIDLWLPVLYNASKLIGRFVEMKMTVFVLALVLLANQARGQGGIALCSQECISRLSIKNSMHIPTVNSAVGQIATGNALMTVGTIAAVGSAVGGIIVGGVAVSEEADATASIATSIVAGVVSLGLVFVGMYVSDTGHEELTKALEDGPSLAFEAPLLPSPPPPQQQPTTYPSGYGVLPQPTAPALPSP